MSIARRPPRKLDNTERGQARSLRSETQQGHGEEKMDMVSYWKDKKGNRPKPFYDEGGELFLIYGYYDHKNQRGAISDEDRCIGVYWHDNYPSSRGHLTPCVIPPKTAKCLLKGLFLELLSLGEKSRADKVSEAIKFLDGEN